MVGVGVRELEMDRLVVVGRGVAVIHQGEIFLEGGSFATNAGASGARYAAGGIGILVIPVVLMLLFRKKYPRWWYDWNLQLARFSNRIACSQDRDRDDREKASCAALRAGFTRTRISVN
jgi:hypothetical protein